MICPVCHKELIRLEPFKDYVYNFWCDTCKMDITVKKAHPKIKDYKSQFTTIQPIGRIFDE